MKTKHILTDHEKLKAHDVLLECLTDLVEAFPPGEDGMEFAGGFGADSALFAARVLLNQIENDLLD